MEILLAKIYLSAIFGLLLVFSVFLIIQIKFRNDLEVELDKLRYNSKYEVKFKIGQIYLRKKMYNKAIEAFRYCFNEWDKNDRLGLSSLLNTLGFMYVQLNDYNKAIYYYQTSLILTPDYITTRLNLEYIYKNKIN